MSIVKQAGRHDNGNLPFWKRLRAAGPSTWNIWVRAVGKYGSLRRT